MHYPMSNVQSNDIMGFLRQLHRNTPLLMWLA
jgi:hypothetical protein